MEGEDRNTEGMRVEERSLLLLLSFFLILENGMCSRKRCGEKGGERVGFLEDDSALRPEDWL